MITNEEKKYGIIFTKHHAKKICSDFETKNLG